jgi:hypothetical protein
MPALQRKFAAGEMDEHALHQEAEFIDDMDSMSKGSIGSKVDFNEINDASDNIRKHSIKKNQAINLMNYKTQAQNKKKDESNGWKSMRGSNVSQSQEPVKNYLKKSNNVDKNKQN